MSIKKLLKLSNSRPDNVRDNKRIAMSKRSQGHVEIMLSFLLFMIAVLLIFVFLNPLSGTRNKNYSEETIQKAILNNLSSTFGKISTFNATATSHCYNITSDLFNRYGDNFVEVPGLQNGGYILYFGDFFNKKHPGYFNGCDKSLYNLGGFSEEKMIVYEKAFDLKNTSDTNYQAARISLGVTNNFAFNFNDLNGVKISEISLNKERPNNLEVGGVAIPVLMIDANGSEREVILNIIVW
jgi:hypothetical protein